MEGTCSQFGTRVIHSFQLIQPFFFLNMALQVLFRFISEFVFKLYQEFHVVEGGTFSCNFDYTKLHVLLSYCTHETHKANILQDTRLLPIQLNGWPKPVECRKEEGIK